MSICFGDPSADPIYLLNKKDEHPSFSFDNIRVFSGRIEEVALAASTLLALNFGANTAVPTIPEVFCHHIAVSGLFIYLFCTYIVEPRRNFWCY